MKEIQLTIPEEVGFSSKNLKYIDDAMERAIKENVMKGMVTLVARHGKIVQFQAYGEAREGVPMQKDAIFRLASMSKPIGAVALMQLFDQGKVMPSDLLSEYIPAFANVEVVQISRSESGKEKVTLVPPKREITVHDLLTMRSGITAVKDAEGDHPGAKYVANLYKKAGIVDTMHPLELTIEDVCNQVSRMPLAAQPGERWNYTNLNSILCGRIVEIVTGQSLRDYLMEHVFGPLNMTETDFFPEEALWDRIPSVYAIGSMERLDHLDVPGTDDTQLAKGPAKGYYNIAAGLHGTVLDYFHFAQMLCNNGTYHGKRILSPNAIRLMKTNHIGTERTSIYGHAWGYMMNVEVDYNTEFNYMGLGSYGWHGYWGSVFNVWPEKDVVAIMISQVSPVQPSWKPQERFLNIVANALLD